MEQLTFNKIEEFVKTLRQEGTPIDHDAFLEWLESLKKDDPAMMEYRLKQHETNLANLSLKNHRIQDRYNKLIHFHDTMFDAVMATAVSALKSSLLINGGACIAMLSILAAIFKDSNRGAPQELKYALICFALGVFVAGIATAATYFAQYNFAYYQDKIAYKFRWAAVGLVVMSYVFFCLGIWKAYLGI